MADCDHFDTQQARDNKAICERRGMALPHPALQPLRADTGARFGFDIGGSLAKFSTKEEAERKRARGMGGFNMPPQERVATRMRSPGVISLPRVSFESRRITRQLAGTGTTASAPVDPALRSFASDPRCAWKLARPLRCASVL